MKTQKTFLKNIIKASVTDRGFWFQYVMDEDDEAEEA